MELNTVEAIAALAATTGAGLFARHVWDRWKAPDKERERSDERFVTVRECSRCETGTKERVEALSHRVHEMDSRNRDDHGALFRGLDEIKTLLISKNGSVHQ